MKEEAGTSELEDLLRDALNNGVESSRGGSPILQLKTTPLQIQDLSALPAVEPPPESSRLVSQSVPPKAMEVKAKAAAQAKKGKKSTGRHPVAQVAPPAKPRSRTSTYALVAMGALALAAAGGAAWRAKHRPVAAAPVPAATDAAEAAPQASEGAVGIAVASRPADAPKVEASAEAADPAKPVVAAARPAVPMAPRPGPGPGPVAAAPAAPAPRPEPKAAAAPPPPAPAPAPAPSPASVDAILQQQLKGAIP